MTLPVGFQVRVAPGVLTLDGGRLLVGGAPLTALRLSSRGVSHIGRQGITVTDRETDTIARRLLATNLGQPRLHELAPVDAAELTVVIPVRDRPAQLDRALGALGPLRTVVVDDASHDSASVAAVARRHHAEVVVLPVNLGPAGARNAGLRIVTTPYVAFVDSDVEVTADDLLALSRHFADPDVALVGPRVVGLARSAHPRWFERYDEVASSLTLGTTPALVRPGGAVAWLPSACLVARTDSPGAGFDPALRVGEDVDLVWRMVDQGRLVRYEPAVTARHDTRGTLRGWLGRKAYYGSGSAELARRHGDRVAPAVLSTSYALAAAALLLRLRWSVPLAGLAVVAGTRSVRSALPAGHGTEVAAVRVAVRGLGWAVRQESALLLRHSWPAAVAGAIASRHLRRAIFSALVVDTVLAAAEQRNAPSDPIPPAILVAGRRLDDLAYGAGL